MTLAGVQRKSGIIEDYTKMNTLHFSRSRPSGADRFCPWPHQQDALADIRYYMFELVDQTIKLAPDKVITRRGCDVAKPAMLVPEP